MADIIQQVGFETKQAITALNNLSTAIKAVNTDLATFNKRASATAGQGAADAFSKVATQANSAKSAVTQTGKALQTTGTQGKAAVQKISIGFSGLAKALVAREIVQAINRLKTAILESADAAAEFEDSVARISNIAQGPQSSIAELTETIGNLSVELARPSTEVAEAAFEALQNDLGTTRETMDLLGGSAQNLALITGGTLTQSVNAITSVLKAYNLDISEAGGVTDIFFAAIDKGRITLADLESSLGKITPLAAKLDIEFDQVAAAMAAITQSGTTAAVANTQLRSIFQKLIKPTDELQEAFTKLGATNFQDLIAQSGSFQAALEGIADALGNDDQAIATAFGRLRGQLGVFNLLANEGKIFTETLEAVANSAGTAAKAADVLKNTDAFAARKEGEEFAKTMREIGEEVLKAKTAFLAFANDVLPSGQAIVEILLKMGTAVLVLGSGAALGSLIAFESALGAVGVTALAVAAALAPFIAAAAIGFGIGEAIDAVFESSAEKLEAIATKVEEANERIEKSSSEALIESNRQIDQLLASRGKAFDDYVVGLERAFNLEIDIIRQASNTASKVLGSGIQDFADGMRGVFKDMKSDLTSLQDDLEDAADATKTAKQKLDDFEFDQKGQKIGAARNFLREVKRIQTSSDRLRVALEKAKFDPAAIPEAERLSKILGEQGKALARKAKADKDSKRQARGAAVAAGAERKHLQANFILAQNTQIALEKRESVTGSVLAKNELISAEIERQVTLLGELLATSDKQGKLKSQPQLALDEEAAEDVFKEILRLNDSFTKDLFKAFEQDQNVQKLTEGLQKAFATGKINFDAVKADLRAKLAEPDIKVFVDLVADLPDFGKKVNEAVQAAVSVAGVSPVAQAEAARGALGDSLKQQTAAQSDFTKATNKFANLQEATASSLQDAISQRLKIDRGTVKQLVGEFTTLQARLSDPNLTKAGLAEIKIAFVGLGNTIEGLATKIGQKSKDSLLAAVASTLKQVDEAESIITLQPQFSEESIAQITAHLDSFKVVAKPFADVATSLTKSATSAQTAATGTANMKSNIASAVGPANSLANNLERAAVASAKVAANRYHGGKTTFRATGGRGADTQLTATSPGEFIVNSRSTRQFFSQIQAMNAGQSPQFRDTGGAVTNIGDINVNVTGGAGSENPDSTGRQIANSLRRELRRKTSAL